MPETTGMDNFSKGITAIVAVAVTAWIFLERQRSSAILVSIGELKTMTVDTHNRQTQLNQMFIDTLGILNKAAQQRIAAEKAAKEGSK